MQENKNEEFNYDDVPVDKDEEYIYNHDAAYLYYITDSIGIEKGSIAINVEKDKDWYSFNLKSDEKKVNYRIFYRWAFVKNTEHNKKVLAFREERKRIVEDLEKINCQEFEQIFKDELKEFNNKQKLPYKCTKCGGDCVRIDEKEAKDFYVKYFAKELEPIDNIMICLIFPLGLMKCEICNKIQNISYNSIGKELFSVERMPKLETVSFLNKGSIKSLFNYLCGCGYNSDNAIEISFAYFQSGIEKAIDVFGYPDDDVECYSSELRENLINWEKENGTKD